MSQSFTLKRGIAWNTGKIVSDTLNHLQQFALLASRFKAQTETRNYVQIWVTS
jgi:hypothetical protein